MQKFGKLFGLALATVCIAGCVEVPPEEEVGCPEGFKDCDGDVSNGCETDVSQNYGLCPVPNTPGTPNQPNQPGTPNNPGNTDQPNQPGTPENSDCTATFYYTNQYTRVETGGEQDWDVYLAGSFNAWKEADASYKMEYTGRGVHKKTIQVSIGQEIEYKYYINGWGEDSWKTDATDGTSNGYVKISSCGMSFGNGNGVDVSNPGSPDTPVNPNPPAGDCISTFKFHNPYTNVASGGAADFDVYLVGSFNMDGDTWKTTDPAYKMTSDGYGTHTITVHWPVGTQHEYKYYVNGWEADAWKTDAADGSSNGVANVSACGMTFGYTGNPDVPVNPDPGQPDGKCTTTFTYYNEWTNVASGGAADFDVYLVGSFNMDGDTWKTTDSAYKMTSDGKGTHTITVEWPVGTRHEYKYYVNGWEADAWKTDAADGQSNGVAEITSCGMKFGHGGNGGGSTITPNKGINLASVPTVNGKTIQFTVKLENGGDISVSGGVAPTIQDMTITDTVPENGKYAYIVKSGDDELYVPVWVEDEKFDWHDALLYFAFTDRFKDGNPNNNRKTPGASVEGTSNADWMGGDFKGLQEKVEDGYFDRLGVNTLWISSVTMNTDKVSYGTNGDNHGYSAYHSYWPIASFMTANNQHEFDGIAAIESHFGTMDELKSLVDACHKRGIRVLVDFAANHVHTDSPMYKKHQDWFNMPMSLCDSDGNWDKIPETCWFSQDLPDINYNKPEVRQLMVEHALWLIKTTNIDGFRVDAVKHMPIEFIKELRSGVESLFANTGIMFYMVGETFTGDIGLLNKYIGNDTLHAQFDFPLYYQIQNVLRDGGMSGIHNSSTLYSYNNPYNSDLMGTFMGNHDVARAISVAAGQNEGKWTQNPDVHDSSAYFRLKQAWTILLTNPGIPLIYYGDEYGMVGGNDPDNRRMMNFNLPEGEQANTLGYVQLLGTLRSQHKAITRGKREDLDTQHDKWCYKLSYNNETILVGVAAQYANGTCNLQGSYNAVSLLNGNEVNGMTHIDFNADKFQIYRLK